MDKDTKNINITLPTRWEELTEKQLRYVFLLIAQGYSIDEVKAFCLFRWNKITILHRIDDMKARNSCMDTMRELFRQFMSKLILEKTKLENHCIYIDPRISFNEIDRYFFSGCACAYFQIAVDVYTDLRINPDEWNE